MTEDIELVNPDHPHVLERNGPVPDLQRPLLGIADGFPRYAVVQGDVADRGDSPQFDHGPLKRTRHARPWRRDERKRLVRQLPAVRTVEPMHGHLDVSRQPAEVLALDQARLDGIAVDVFVSAMRADELVSRD